MKILIASVSFYPRISPRSYRATELAKEFARQGHDVTVYTHIDNEKCKDFCEKHNINIVDFTHGKWSFSKSTNKNSVFRLIKKSIQKLLKYFFQWPELKLSFLLKEKLKFTEGYDLLISIAVPHSMHWGVSWAMKRNMKLTKTWIADCGDPFMRNSAVKIPLPFYFKYVEKLTFRRADFITVPFEGAVNGYYSEFHKKISVISQGFNFDEAKLFSDEIDTKIPTFAYAGSFIKGLRDPKRFFELLCEIDLEFKFIIYSNNISLVKPYVNILKEKVELRTKIPRSELIYELSKMDFLVNFGNQCSIQLPSKLIDYAITERPIFNVNIESVCIRDIELFLNKNYSNQFTIDDIEQYKIDNVAKKFLLLT